MKGDNIEGPVRPWRDYADEEWARITWDPLTVDEEPWAPACDHRAALAIHAAGVRVTGEAGLDVERLMTAVDAAIIGMVRTSWPMDRSAEEKGWNEALHASRKKARAAIAREYATIAREYAALATGDEP